MHAHPQTKMLCEGVALPTYFIMYSTFRHSMHVVDRGAQERERE